jgi:hypothetical protein
MKDIHNSQKEISVHGQQNPPGERMYAHDSEPKEYSWALSCNHENGLPRSQGQPAQISFEG